MEPKTKGKGYIPIMFLIEKGSLNTNSCSLDLVDNKMLIDGREVNGFQLRNDGQVIIKGEHYTSRTEAARIRSTRKFRPSVEDNYSYFLESGFEFDSLDLIRKISGAASAEVKFEVIFTVSAKRVWVKVEKKHPLKFAIEHGIKGKNIIEISIQRISLI